MLRKSSNRFLILIDLDFTIDHNVTYQLEARLKKVEATVSEVVGMVSALETSVDGLKSHSHDAPPVATGDVGAVVAALKAQWPNKFTDL